MRDTIKRLFLFEYTNASFVIKQKAYVLLWLHLLSVPLFSIILVINSVVLEGELFVYMTIIDCSILSALILGLILLRKGKYFIAVNFITAVITTVLIIDCYAQFDYFKESGNSSYIYLMFIVLVFAALFGNRLLPALIALLFIIVILVSLFFAVSGNPAIAFGSDKFDYFLGIAINGCLSILVIFFISYLVIRITEKALKKTEDLNMSLELKVDERTEELQAALSEMEMLNKAFLKANTDLTAAKRITDQDIYMATNIQSSLFPKEPPRSPHWDIAFSFQPMAGVSGDLYDFYEKEGELCGLTLCDVSGHGVASGLITMIARSVIHRNFAQGQNNPLNCIIEKTNRELIGEIGSLENYLTGIILRFNQDRVEYVNAGHPSMLLKHAGNGTVEKIDARDRDFKGCLLGLKSIQLPFGIISFDMALNDTLLLYSDGLTENINKKNEMFDKHLPGLFNQAPPGSARDILGFLLQGLYDFMGNTGFRDDITVLVVRKR
ncbi:MAG: serine/threonine-protein phosphatase [bacterium]|nr:serine/threonine-protein phosphatase [bacterium]